MLVLFSIHKKCNKCLASHLEGFTAVVSFDFLVDHSNDSLIIIKNRDLSIRIKGELDEIK